MNISFSIITCSLNSSRFLRDNINSIRSQTFSNFEHIFIDGFSSDGTKEMILEYQKTNPEKIKLSQLKPNGIANAMNEGVKIARGEYIIHLHSDDYLHDKNVLSDVENFLKEKKYPDWIYSRELSVNIDGHIIKTTNRKIMFKQGYKTFLTRYLLKYYNYIRHQSVFIKRNMFNKYGYFDETFNGAMDYEYWLRIKDNTNWIFFDRTIDCFRVHEGGMSSSMSSRIAMQLEEMRAGRLYMNPIEFYIMRSIFKILAIFISNVREQFTLYRKFLTN